MDAIEEWTAAQARVIELAGSWSDEQAATRVPATPDWTVRELLAHMVGLDADVLAGDEPDDHNSDWTQAHVDRRADHEVAALVAEWQGLTTGLQQWMADHNVRPLGDLIIHEQDLRGALGQPGARDTPGLMAIRRTMADRLAGSISEAGLAPIALTSDTWAWTSGRGDPGVRIEASDFDLARAVTSRRTVDQLRGWAIAGDVEPYLPHFAVLGDLPDDALPE